MKSCVTVLAALLVAAPAVGSASLAPGPEYSTQIVNGRRATPGQFPHMAGITMDQTDFCGGSIISESWVLTAAHCVADITTFVIVFGTLKAHGEQDTATRTSTSSISHPQYNPGFGSLANDIALIGLPTPLTFNKLIRPVKLATDPAENYVGKLATIPGWGFASDESHVVSQDLNFATIGIIDNAEGAAYFGEYVTDKTIVTDGSKLNGPCTSDSGGPLTVTSGFFVRLVRQVGVVSFGSGTGCSKGYPTVFTKVASYVDWLQNTTGLQL